ncbi:hypothetical protein V8E36_002511 [Tilletia maclaganii]
MIDLTVDSSQLLSHAVQLKSLKPLLAPPSRWHHCIATAPLRSAPCACSNFHCPSAARDVSRPPKLTKQLRERSLVDNVVVYDVDGDRPGKKRFQKLTGREAAAAPQQDAHTQDILARIATLHRCACDEVAQWRPYLALVYDVGMPYYVNIASCRPHLVEELLNAGLFPAIPTRPEAVFTMRLLRWFQALINHTGLGAKTWRTLSTR